MNNESPNKEFWDNCYENGKTGWDRGVVHPALTHWLHTEELTPCRVAIPGCGNGYEAVTLAKLGFDVVAIDYAEVPLKQLREKLRGFEANANVIDSDVFDFTPSSKFDAIYEQTCLCAIEPSQRESYEQKLFDWLDVGGSLFVLFLQNEKATGGPPFHCDLDDMKKLFDESRWDWTNTLFPRHEHPSGSVFEFAAHLKRK